MITIPHSNPQSLLLLDNSLDKRPGFVYNGPVFIYQTHEEVEVENA
jgi:hypothetical protein